MRREQLLADQQHQREGGVPNPADNSVTALLEIALVGGEHLFVAQEVSAGSGADPVALFDTLFTTSSFSFLMRAGGIAVLNVAQLLWFTLYPSSVESSADVWQAQYADYVRSEIVDENQSFRKSIGRDAV